MRRLEEIVRYFGELGLSRISLRASLRISPRASSSASGPHPMLGYPKSGYPSGPGLPRISLKVPTSLPPVGFSSVPTVLINCLRNNIFITVSSTPGRHIFHLSAGTAGFSGSQKTSPKAAMAMLDTLQRKLEDLKIQQVRLNFRGLNSARAILIGHIRRMGLQVTEVVDTTRVPFNGCRPPKAKRL